MNRFKTNLKLLKRHDPVLAKRVEVEPYPENLSIIQSKDGSEVPVLNDVSLHSTYYPIKEAADSLNGFNPDSGSVAVVLGLGFGYHVRHILERLDNAVVVIEPRMDLFRAFMEHEDLADYLPRVQFRIAEPVPKLLGRNQTSNWDLFVHQASAFVSPEYFETMERCVRVMDLLENAPLRILVVNPIYGGSLPTARFCKEALKTMGHVVDSVDCEAFKDSYFAIQNVTQVEENRKALSHHFMNLMGEAVTARAIEFKPDLVLALAQAPMSPDAISKLKEMKIPVAFWFVEDCRTLTYWKDMAPQYDYFFTIQQSEFLDELEQLGQSNHYYLPQAAHPSVHRPLELSEEERRKFKADLSFMGEGYYNRHRAFVRLLDQDFKIWGTGWTENQAYWPHIQNKGQRVTSEECVSIYNAGKVNLNLHSSTYHDGIHPNGDFVNPRTFEIAACGGFQLVDARSELADCFRIGEEIITFSNLEEMREKALYYLEHEDERLQLARKARERVLSEHTIQHRMQEMLLFIYSQREEELHVRLEGRNAEIDRALQQVEGDAELKAFLEPFRGKASVTFQSIIEQINENEGTFSDPELLFLMVDQILPKKGRA